MRRKRLHAVYMTKRRTHDWETLTKPDFRKVRRGTLPCEPILVDKVPQCSHKMNNIFFLLQISSFYSDVGQHDYLKILQNPTKRHHCCLHLGTQLVSLFGFKRMSKNDNARNLI